MLLFNESLYEMGNENKDLENVIVIIFDRCKVFENLLTRPFKNINSLSVCSQSASEKLNTDPI